jgi:hypothetical protein
MGGLFGNCSYVGQAISLVILTVTNQKDVTIYRV